MHSLQESPAGDHTFGTGTDYFLFVSAQKSSGGSGFARFTSPKLLTSQHPQECLSFWFQLKVIITLTKSRL